MKIEWLSFISPLSIFLVFLLVFFVVPILTLLEVSLKKDYDVLNAWKFTSPILPSHVIVLLFLYPSSFFHLFFFLF